MPLFYLHIVNNLAPFVDIGSFKKIDCQYAQSAGVGAVTQFGVKLEEALWQTYCGFISTGFSVDMAEGQLRTHGLDNSRTREYIDDRSVFIPCIRNAEMLQINAVSLNNVKELQAAKGLAGKPGHAGPLETLCLYGRMPDEELRRDIISHVPVMSRVFDRWNSSGLSNFELTAVGIAVGHAYWRKTTGGAASLDTWL